MGRAIRSTLVVHSRLAMREARLEAARAGRHGLQVMTFEQAAARLAGGFMRPIDDEALREAVQEALRSTPMGEFDGIRGLPGMVGAAADTLHGAWRAAIDLSSRTGDHPRIGSIARLEEAVLAVLPDGMMRPVDIVAAATDRIHHAPAVIGPVLFEGMTDLAPCWRPLACLLARTVPVTWAAGPRSTPGWLDPAVTVERTPPETPSTSVVSAATAYHEAIEAMRWARSLLASGVDAAEIAIAAASPADYDADLLALRADADFDLHFVHGVPAVTTRDGQAAAALADVVVRGITQTRLRRLASLCRESGPLSELPKGWLGVLPDDAPLSTPAAWNRLLARLTPEDWPDGVDRTPTLRDAVDVLGLGPGAATAVGEAFLGGRALEIWRRALLAGPAASIDATLETIRQDDGLEACASVSLMPADELAASPRRHVRLLGLNSSRWPRAASEDRLIPDHVVPARELDPLPPALSDRRHFETILATTADEVVMSYARRDVGGRLLGRSPLLVGREDVERLRSNAVPRHAFSETDRLMARPWEFGGGDQAISAKSCWTDWRREGVTPHDGLVRADHPLIVEVLDRTQSASSLRTLLRNPLGFVWRYAFGWKAPRNGAEPLVLDPLRTGDLIHLVLERTLRALETAGGLAAADGARIGAAVAAAADDVAAGWEARRPVPPDVVWRRTLDDARSLAVRALAYDDHSAGTASYGEVPFGGAEVRTAAALPWDAAVPVDIPDAGFRIEGYIDRLDVAADGGRALVRDYKTGRPPRNAIRLDGGRELQRCLYAFAVRRLLGEDVEISASLLYLREPLDLRLEAPDEVMREASGHLRSARRSLMGGAALPGPDTGGDFDALAFALPANAEATYAKHKRPAVAERMGGGALVWEAE